MQRLIINAIREAAEFIHEQKAKGVINGVITKKNELINDDFEYCIKDWLFEPRVIGERLKTAQSILK